MASWTEEELKILADNYHKGAEECHKLLPGHTYRAIVHKAQVIGVRTASRAASTRVKWSEEDLDVLRDYCHKGLDVCVELLPGRTKNAIYYKAYGIGLSFKKPVTAVAAKRQSHKQAQDEFRRKMVEAARD